MIDDNLPVSEPSTVYQSDYRATHERLAALEAAFRDLVAAFRAASEPVLSAAADAIDQHLPTEGKRP